MDIVHGISVSMLEKMFHSNYVYDTKTVGILTQIREKIKKICTIDSGIGIQKQYFSCQHLQAEGAKSGDSYSFNLVENKQPENILYNTCVECGNTILQMLKAEFGLISKIRHDKPHPQLNLILQALAPNAVNNFVFSVFLLVPAKSLKILPNILGILNQYLNSRNYEKDEFLEKTIEVFNAIKPYFTTKPVIFEQPNDIDIVDEIAGNWLPLVDYFKNKNDENGVKIIELNQIATKRFFLSSSQPPSVALGALIMVKANQLNKEAMELAKSIQAHHVIDKIAFDVSLECLMASTYLVQSSYFNLLLEYCLETWKPLAHESGNYESEIRACFAHAEAAIRVKYNPAIIKQALALIEEGYDIAEKKNLDEMKFMGLMTWGDVYGTRNSPEAIDYREKAIQLAKKMENEKLLMQAYHNAFVDYIRQNKFEDALEYINLYHEKVKKQLTPENTQLYIKSLQSQWDIYLKLGFPQKAAEVMQEQIAFLKQQPQMQQQSFNEFYQQYESLANKMAKGMTTKSLKKEFSNMEGQLRTSLNFLEQNVISQLAVFAPQSPDLANNLMSAGKMKNMLGDYTGATIAYETALQIHEINQNILLVADCYSELGKIQFKKKKLKNGIGLIQQAINLRKEGNVLDLAYILDNTILGLAYRKQGKLKEALEILEEASKTAILYAEGKGLESTRILYSGVISNTIEFYCETAYQLAQKESKNMDEIMFKALEIVETFKNREIINRFQSEGRKEDCPQNEILFARENELVEELATLDYLKDIIMEREKSGQMTSEEAKDKRLKAETKIEKIKNEIEKLRAEIYLECVSPGQIPKPISYSVIKATSQIVKEKQNWAILQFLLIPQFDEDFMWSLMMGMEAKHLSKVSDLLGETDDEFSEYKKFTAVAYMIDGKSTWIDTQAYDVKELDRIKDAIIEAVDSASNKNISNISSEIYEKLIPQKIKQKLKEGNYEHLTIIPDKFLHAIPWEIVFDGDTYFGLKYSLS
ncbi:MAG: tetratricopeptide repeat protein, partial [Asgard group archaeon]|nr:tetratricopeptide repeat protein [Asgard group archaeon]